MSAAVRKRPTKEPHVDIAGFEAANIDAGAFTHESHVYLAWRYLQETTLPEALSRYSAALKRLTKKLGVESKYHETITWFFIFVLAERLDAGDSGDWQTFKSNNPDLVADAKSLLTRHYSKQRLGSPMARRQFLLPDLAPLAQGGGTI